MRLEIDNICVSFWSGDLLAGRYHFADEFKPYIGDLSTPAGYVLSLVSPHDHKHHKGLMYALRIPEVNFWEERSTLDGEVPGRQRHDTFTEIVDSGEDVGFTEILTWLPHAGGEAVFVESRTIHCRALPDSAGFIWRWVTDITAMRDLELIMSQWSAPAENGQVVNYHGLGLRLRRDFGCTGGNALLLDGTNVPFPAGMGAVPVECEFHGSLDGTWPVKRAGVRIRQDQQYGLFILETPFAFLSLGPSNLGPRALGRGDQLSESYLVTVFDLPRTAGS
jgi:hypothetical protein